MGEEEEAWDPEIEPVCRNHGASPNQVGDDFCEEYDEDDPDDWCDLDPEA